MREIARQREDGARAAALGVEHERTEPTERTDPGWSVVERGKAQVTVRGRSADEHDGRAGQRLGDGPYEASDEPFPRVELEVPLGDAAESRPAPAHEDTDDERARCGARHDPPFSTARILRYARGAMRLSSLVLAVVLLGGCREAPALAPARHDVTVFAAASLREAFTELGRALEASHPDAHVVLSFAGSQTLRAQIEQGAPADVFASADERHMKALAGAQRVLEPRVFANNELVIVVANAKAELVKDFAALPKAERIVLGAPEVPVGAYTKTMLEKAQAELGGDFAARVESHVVSREPDVRQVLAKVSLGEADAGIVYRTDALTAAGKVAVVAVPLAYNVVARYPVAVTANAPAPQLAKAFVELLVSPEGARVLKSKGFTPVGDSSARP